MVVSRFAPSPTGYLHLGNARTAIFSYLFARHHRGKFILRIEDTDIERSTKEFEDMLIKDLRWLGLEWDEFYRQSERFEIYRRYAEELLASGHAYACFCMPEELERERQEAERKGVPYRYSGKCSVLNIEEAEHLKRQGKPYAIRFRVPYGESIVFEDMLRGHISINADDFGDFVIVRSDGTPTYNFVVVVDDALMGVTHVIRGEDHIPNTPKQILIYRALGFLIPKFVHLPVILGEDRSKLSKRHGAVSVKNYREEGYLPEALFNYLCLLGWSAKEGREIYSKDELIDLFDLKDINLSPAVFSKEKLRWMNGVYIREVVSLERLVQKIKPFLEKAGYDVSNEDYLKKVLERTRDSFETLTDAVDRLAPFFLDDFEISPSAWNELENVRVYEILSTFLEEIKGKKLSSSAVKEIASSIQRKLGVRAKDVWHSLRIAFTGELEGIGVDIICDLVPQERLENRIVKILKKVS